MKESFRFAKCYWLGVGLIFAMAIVLSVSHVEVSAYGPSSKLCRHNLQQIAMALMHYKSMHGFLPEKLTDLIPEFAEAGTLVCRPPEPSSYIYNRNGPDLVICTKHVDSHTHQGYGITRELVVRTEP
jgi:hypothetical protein